MGRSISPTTTVTVPPELPWSPNPKTLPRTYGTPVFKIAPDTIVSTSTAGSQTTLAARGATASITANDTYVTACDLTGSGFLFHVIGPGSGGTDIRTLRITIDGVVYTLATSAGIAAAQRFILGPLFEGNPSTTSTGSSTSDVGLFGGYNYDVVTARTGGLINVGNAYIPTENEVLCHSLPCIRFETSCKVEGKCATKSVTADPMNALIALYRLDL